MNRNKKIFSLDFRSINWKAILLFTIACFYVGLIVIWERDSGSPIKYGGDYLAFWSAGKVADEKGYSEIYNLENLKSVQMQALNKLGFLQKSILPAPYLSVFLVPFQLLSRVELQLSYWIWTLFNLLVLIGYLVFFFRNTSPGKSVSLPDWGLLLLLLLSFPVFDNLANGQLNIFLMICTGEFIRNSLNNKTFLSGVWLAGLLLKPQLLILIVPIILLMRYCKVLLGFVVSSMAIMLTSLLLSGFAGMNGLINLLTRWGEGNAVTAPETMINWRMVGVNLSILTESSTAGWIITGLGIALTVLGVYFLVKRNPAYGSPEWVVIMLGVYSATLAVTWHAHYHMAMVLIPFLIYASANKLLPGKISFLWVILTPIAWFGVLVIGAITLYFAKINIFAYQEPVIAFSGLIVNLVVLISTLRYTDIGKMQR